MPNRDYYSPNKVLQVVAPQKVAATASGVIDVRVGDAVLIIANIGGSTGTPTSANRYDLVALEADTTTMTFTAVSASELLNSIAGTTIGSFGSVNSSAALNQAYKASYVGKKRFLKVQETKVSSAPSIQSGITAVIGDLAFAPNP